jgi:opacity protein-like surface antigen
MKKILSLVVAGLMLLSFAKAQDNVFKNGDMVANVGIGLGSALYSGTGYKGSIPPVSISLEKGVRIYHTSCYSNIHSLNLSALIPMKATLAPLSLIYEHGYSSNNMHRFYIRFFLCKMQVFQ